MHRAASAFHPHNHFVAALRHAEHGRDLLAQPIHAAGGDVAVEGKDEDALVRLLVSNGLGLLFNGGWRRWRRGFCSSVGCIACRRCCVCHGGFATRRRAFGGRTDSGRLGRRRGSALASRLLAPGFVLQVLLALFRIGLAALPHDGCRQRRLLDTALHGAQAFVQGRDFDVAARRAPHHAVRRGGRRRGDNDQHRHDDGGRLGEKSKIVEQEFHALRVRWAAKRGDCSPMPTIHRRRWRWRNRPAPRQTRQASEGVRRLAAHG